MHRRRYLRRRRGGFTLMEVLLVLAILVILGSLVGLSIISMSRRAKEDSARAQLGMLKSALEAYHLDMGSYPNTNQGLQALLQPPADLKNPRRWRGPYLKSMLPLDPWDNEYAYEGGGDQFRIWSFGPNAINDGGANDDIVDEG